MQGSVRKKGATWSYRIELGITNGKRNQIERSGFKTKKEATMAMQEVIYNYNSTGDFVENKKVTFEEVYNEFIEKEAPATRAYATIVRYKSLYRNHFHDAFGKYYVYQINANMINDFINQKATYLSEEYVKGLFKFLKVLFGYAHKRQYTKKNIFPEVIAPPDPRHVGEIKTYTKDELNAMEERLQGTNVIVSYYIALNTGLRESEVFGLQWEDVDFENKKIKVCKQLLFQDRKWCFCPLKTLKFDYKNRITVTVLKKAENSPVQNIRVTASEADVPDTETKSLSNITNAGGIVVFPALTEDITDDNGNSDVSETTPGKGEDTDGDGNEDVPGEDVETKYTVSVKDTQGIISNAFVEIKDGKIYVTLPETHTLTTSNQTTVTVTDKDGKAVQGVSVTIKDKTTEKTAATNASGQVTLPVKSSGGGGGSSSGGSSGGGGGGYSSYSTVNVKVTDKDGKSVSVTKSVDSKGNVTVTLPAGKVIDSENYYTVTVTDSKGAAKADTTVTLKDRKNGTATGTTDKNGMLTLPAKEHKAYIVGYDDGTFKPDSDMSRAEAAAIFARLIAEAKGESISGKASFKDVDKNEWYAGYVGYLEKYDVITGYNDGTFKPDASVTRAEFVAMTVRYYDLFNDVNKKGNTVKYTDVANSYWAYSDIAFAKNIGWLNGYSDGSFRGDNDITRAEVVTVVNRATGRIADKEYVKDNFIKLNRFTDVTDSNMWYFFDVCEAANSHMSVSHTNSETWVK